MRSLKEGGYYQVSRWADDLLWRIPFAQSEIAVNLYRVTGHQLGFTTIYTTTQFFKAVKSHDFTKLPAEIGPALRLGYDDQPIGEIIRVGMEPIVNSDGNLSIFRVGPGGGDRWLGADYAAPAGEWNPEDVWVVASS